MVVGSNPVAVTSPSDFAPASSKEFLDIQATIECGFTLKTRTLHDKNIQLDKYRLNEINKIKEDFNKEINERKDIINKLNKYIIGFGYLDKIFITLSASFGTLSVASHATVIGIPAGIGGASLTLIFTISTGINKSLLQVTKKKKKKHNKIITLAKDKLNIIDTLLSSALNDLKISHEEFSNIMTEKNAYENLKNMSQEKSTTL